MALDGIVTAALRAEIENKCQGGVIARIIQPTKDILQLSIKCGRTLQHLHMSVSGAAPLLYLTEDKETAPPEAPAFCMLLRKHLSGGILKEVTQPSLERCLRMAFLTHDELYDERILTLVIEMMGKHSNIILIDASDRIMDSIHRVPPHMSSVRTVLPGMPYFLPSQEGKHDPFSVDKSDFMALINNNHKGAAKALSASFTGLSGRICEDLCYAAGIDPRADGASLSDAEREALRHVFFSTMQKVQHNEFDPVLVTSGSEYIDFYAFPYASQSEEHTKHVSSMSACLQSYYATREKKERMKQQSSTMRSILHTAMQRVSRKLDLQEKQMKDTERMDTYRLRGELLRAYAHTIPEGADHATLTDYHSGDDITIALDPTLSVHENANRLFARYQKYRRTKEALLKQLELSRNELRHLQSIETSLALSEDAGDLADIRREMAEAGLMKKASGKRSERRADKARPLQFRSSDGFDIFVGKNNYQNEYVSFTIARPDDWWFHANDIPGSHVVIRGNGQDVPDRTIEEAARLAAHFSKAGDSDKVEVDYLLRKHLKKPGGNAPGFVIYHTNYSMIASTDISGIERVTSRQN